MIWHIFRKDWKLLWKFVIAVAAVHFASAAVRFTLDHYGENETLESLLQLFMVMSFFGAGFLVAAMVHLDAVPGVRQDWLVRPVNRRDLMLAKVLFLILLVHGPSFAADAIQALADGFPLAQALSAAAGRSVYLLLYLSLPMLAYCSLTRSMTETVVGGVGVFLAVVALSVLFRNSRGPTTYSGLVWVGESMSFTLSTLGAIVVLLIQYFRRKTKTARVVACSVGLLCLATGQIPWKPAFAIEQRMSPNPGSAGTIQVAFDPGMGRFQRPSGIRENRNLRRPDEPGIPVHLPMRFSGLPADMVLRADRAELHITGPDGKRVLAGLGDDLLLRLDGAAKPRAQAFQTIVVRTPVFNRLEDQPVRMEIDYSLTLSRLSASFGLPALNANETVTGLGWCRTSMNEVETAVELRCVQAGRGPICIAGFLEHIPSGRRNPEQSGCIADYSPYFRRLAPDAMSRGGVAFRFRDPSGLAKFPVDGPQLAESRLVVRFYEPEDHFARHVETSEIKLRDWEAQ